MLDVFSTIYTNMLHYVFGSAFYVSVTFILFLVLVGLMFNLDGGSFIVLIVLGSVLGSMLFLPMWVGLTVMVILLLVMAIILVRLVGVNR
jgi:hypothetical protein